MIKQLVLVAVFLALTVEAAKLKKVRLHERDIYSQSRYISVIVLVRIRFRSHPKAACT